MVTLSKPRTSQDLFDRRGKVQLLASILLAIALCGCASTAQGPYAEISGERMMQADVLEEGIRILAVDEQLSLGGSQLERLEPGLRLLRLETARVQAAPQFQQISRHKPLLGGIKGALTLPLNAKPCLRYHVAARHESMSQIEPWQLVLRDVEPIPECIARFPEHRPQPARPSAS